MRPFTRSAVSVFVVAVVLTCPPASLAVLVIDLPDVTIYSDNVNPAMDTLEIVLTLTGTAPMVSGFNLDFSTSGSGLSFAAAEAATTSPLLTGGTFLSLGTSTNVQAAHDIFPSSVTAFNNAGLIKVPFTVAALTVGNTYPLTWNGSLTLIADEEAMSLPVMLEGGSITVAAIPEAVAWQSLLLVALILAAVKWIASCGKGRGSAERVLFGA